MTPQLEHYIAICIAILCGFIVINGVLDIFRNSK